MALPPLAKGLIAPSLEFDNLVSNANPPTEKVAFSRDSRSSHGRGRVRELSDYLATISKRLDGAITKIKHNQKGLFSLGAKEG